MSPLRLVLATSHPAPSARSLGGYCPIRRVIFSPCLSAASIRFLAVVCPLRIWPSLTIGLLDRSRRQRGFHVSHRQETSGKWVSLCRERGTISAGSLIPADLRSSKDVLATCVPFCVTTLQPRLHSHSTRLRLFLA